MVNDVDLRMFLAEAAAMGYEPSDFRVTGSEAGDEVRIERLSTGKETGFGAELGGRWCPDALGLLEGGFFGPK